MSAFLRVAARVVLPIVLVGLVLALFYANLEYVTRAPARNDFFPRWEGGRAWIRAQESPYDPAVSERSQQRAYGRPANEQRGEDPLHFLYPFPAVAIFGPLGWLAEDPAHALWMSLLEIGLFAATWLWIRAAQWRTSVWMTVSILGFSVLWYPAFATLVSAQFAAMEAVLLAGAVAAIQARREALGGLLLAATLMKPQVSLGIVIYTAIWALVSRRRQLLGWLLTGLVVVFGGSLLLEPGWPAQMARQAFDYLDLPVFLSPLGRLSAWLGTGQVGTLVLTGLLFVYLVWEWKESVPGEARRFLWTAGLTQTIALLILPFGTVPNLILLLFPIAVVLEAWYARQGSAIDAPAGIMLLVLAGGTWLVSLGQLEGGDPSLVLLVGLPLATIVALFWVRWWSFRAREGADLGVRIP